MTARENMLAVLRGQPHDEMPVVALIDNYHHVWPLEQPVNFGVDDYVAQMRYFGGDVIQRGWDTVAPLDISWGGGVQVSSTTEGDIVTERIETPSGILTGMVERNPKEGFFFHRRFPVQSLDDYVVYREKVLNERYNYNPEKNAKTEMALRDLGQDGIAYVCAPCSPFMTILREATGVEQLLYDYFDHPKMLAGLMDLIHARNIEQYELIAQNTPVECIVCWDDAETAQISPDMFAELVVPTIRDYARICHKYGKRMVFHTCGQIADLLPMFPDMEIDAVDWVQHTPTGNVTFDQVQNAWGSQVAILGAVSATIFGQYTGKALEDEICRVLRPVAKKGRFMLMIPPPQYTTEAQMRTAMAAARRSAR